MKRINYYFWTIVLAQCLVSSCTKNNEDDVYERKVELNVKEEIIVSQTKAEITPETPFKAQLVGSETSRQYYAPYVDGRGTVMDFDCDFSAVVDPVTGMRNVTLSKDVYYPISGKKIYMRCFSPAIEKDKVRRSGSLVRVVTDGTVDLVCSDEISGHKSIKEPLTMNLHHCLSQIKFSIKKNMPGMETHWGKIRKIEIIEQYRELELNLSTGNLNYYYAGDDMISYVVYDDPEGCELTETETPIGRTIMLPEDQYGCYIQITTENTTQRVRIPAKLEKGVSKTVCLNFGVVDINLSAKVTPWNEAINYDQDIL